MSAQRDDTALGVALLHGQLAYQLALQLAPVNQDAFLAHWLKRVIKTKAFDNHVLNVLREMRLLQHPSERFNRYLANYLRISSANKTYAGLSDKDRIRHCFNTFRSWGALASYRLAGPGSVPANAPELAEGPGVFFISQADYDQFFDENGNITAPLAMSYFCPLAVTRRVVDVFFSYGLSLAVPNVAHYRKSVFLISSARTVQLNDMERS